MEKSYHLLLNHFHYHHRFKGGSLAGLAPILNPNPESSKAALDPVTDLLSWPCFDLPSPFPDLSIKKTHIR